MSTGKQGSQQSWEKSKFAEDRKFEFSELEVRNPDFTQNPNFGL